MSPRVRIVLQARTTSSRLPAKVLLPIGGLPLAILCAKRLTRRGEDLILATSSEAADDLLCQLATAEGIRIYRGSLQDVLARFLACAEDLQGEDLIVRVTADNPVPDSDFISDLLSLFAKEKTPYLGTTWPSDGLPYGASAEIFTVAALREAGQASKQEDREHVTPYLRMKHSAAGKVKKGDMLREDLSSVRVTVDTLDDYLSVLRIFPSDPKCAVGKSWKEVLGCPDSGRSEYSLSNFNWTKNESPRKSKLMLGTAQLGFEYGRTNVSGVPSDEEKDAILQLARSSGITAIDTARAYGVSEKRIGESGFANGFEIITKISPLTALPGELDQVTVSSIVSNSVYASCLQLNVKYLDVVMLHRYQDVFRWDMQALKQLGVLQREGVIGSIGVSVYEPLEAMHCLQHPEITAIQIPFNILDRRWLAPEIQEQFSRRPDCKIYARSIFLQGLLANTEDKWPDWCAERSLLFTRLEYLVRNLKRSGMKDLCFAFVLAQKWINSLVVGVDTSNQLRELLHLELRPSLTEVELDAIAKIELPVSNRLLNPSLW